VSARLAMQLLQGGRVLLGKAIVVAPEAVGGPWIGAPASTPGGQVALRALGARDAVLGAGAFHAAWRGDTRAAVAWSLGLAACDLVDGVATAVASDELPNRGVPVMGIAFGSAAAGLLIAAKLRG
jgi:hypothetical protein